MSMRLASSWLVAALGLLPSHGMADEFEGVRQAIIKSMAEDEVPGLAVAVWRDGRILWQEGFGWADVKNRVPATEHTMFNLASLSKTLTATGLMTLVQAGRVSLDRPANDYLGPDALKSWIGDPKEVTVRRLANHTSGLAGSDQWFYGTEASMLPSMGEVIHRYGILVAPAGERYQYSNLGYGVLGHLISRVSGESYGDFMRKAVFLPLGMLRTSMNLAPGLEKYQAMRYDFDRKPIAVCLSAEPASASIFSSVHDLARFGMFFLRARLPNQEQILSDESIEGMWRDPVTDQTGPVHRPADDDDGYALGWVTSSRGGYRLVGHSGSASGVSTNFLMVPERKLGVVMVANADQVFLPTTAALEALLPDWRDAGAKVAKESAPKIAFRPSSQLTGTWQGALQTYEGEQPIRLTVFASGEVHVRIGGEPRYVKRSTVRQEALLNDVEFKDGVLTGNSLAQIETTDTKRYPHTTSLTLTLRGNELTGVATAESVYDGLWIYGLPHWATLKRVSTDAMAVH